MEAGYPVRLANTTAIQQYGQRSGDPVSGGADPAIEQIVLGRVKLRDEFRLLKTTPGIGDILALTIMLETGEICRFASVGDFASYCRCVSSTTLTNFKKK